MEGCEKAGRTKENQHVYEKAGEISPSN